MTISKNKSLTYLAMILFVTAIFSQSNLYIQAQTETTFTPKDNFNIPTQNSTINFASKGTYATAKLEKNTWNFTGLKLSSLPPQDKPNLKISSKDSNLTITLFQKFNTSTGGARLRYNVTGQGKQTFNLGILANYGEWTVTFNGVYVAKNDKWNISPDGTITVTGATSLTNITITCYGLPPSLRDLSNQPFYQQHSVAILTAITMTITIIAAATITIKRKFF